MTKQISTNMASHLAEEVTSLTTVWTVTRQDGVVIRLTEHDQDIVVGSNTFTATFGYLRSAVTNRVGLDTEDLELDGLVDGNYLSRDDIRDKKLDGASLEIEIVNWQAPEDGTIKLISGRLGEVFLSRSGRFKVQFNSLRSILSQKVLEKSSPTCRAELGGKRCKFPIQPNLREDNTAYALGDFVRVATVSPAAGDQSDYENRIYECTTAGTSASSVPTMSTTIDSTTTDGTVTWVARDAFTRHGEVSGVSSRLEFTSTLDDNRADADDQWYRGGKLVFETGDNAAYVAEVKTWNKDTATIVLFLETPFDISIGDRFRIEPGDDKNRDTCRIKFAVPNSKDFAKGNVINFRGEPDLPGRDAVLTYPNAR